MVQFTPRSNPFPGLRPFDLDEEHLFFGREGQADELLTRLNRTRFLAVVGTSGSGKSSLVRAGLLPSLYSGFLPDASSGWRVAVMRPGNAPVGNLAAALNDLEVFGVDPTSDDAIIRLALTESTLRRGALGLVEITRQSRMAGHENLLVVVDQFEELFRFRAQAQGQDCQLDIEDEAAAFVKLLLGAVNQREVPIFVVLTMRSDFLGDCAQFRDLPEMLNDSQYLIPRLTREQLKSAIEGPVAVGGATMTPRLVNRLLNETGDNPDQLPILQHALMRTWDYWEDRGQPERSIDIEHYEATGGLAQALSRHADQVYQGLADDPTRRIARTLFKRLTNRGGDNRDVRRPTQLGELCGVTNASEAEVIAVIDQFRASRRSFLMPPPTVPLHSASIIDISHESLMRNWQRLTKWIDEETQSAQIYKRLAETAALHEKGEAGYWRDPELTIGLNWLEKQQPNKVWAERYSFNFNNALTFLLASAKSKGDETAAKEIARQRELRRLRTFLALLSGLSLLTGGAALYAFNQQQAAKAQTLNALRSEQRANLAADKAKQSQQQTQVAFKTAQGAEEKAKRERQLALAARDEAKEQQLIAESAKVSESQQRRSAELARLRAEIGETEARRQSEIAQQQTKLAQKNEVAAKNATAMAQNLAFNSELESQVLAAEKMLASNLRFEAFLEALRLGVKLRDLNEHNSTQAIKSLGTDIVQAGVFDAGETILRQPVIPAIQTQIAAILQKTFYNSKFLPRNILRDHENTVGGVDFSPNGQFLSSASSDGTIKIRTRNGEEIKTLKGHNGPVLNISFGPDNNLVVSAGEDGTVRLWSIDGEELQLIEAEQGVVRDVAFSPNGKLIASSGDHGTIKIWDLNGQVVQTLQGHSSRVWSIAFSPDGDRIASASADHTAKIWSLDGQELVSLVSHTDAVRSISFSPDNETLATASEDRSIKLWKTTGEKLRDIKSIDLGQVWDIEFFPGGQTLVSASDDSTLRVWDLEGNELEAMKGHIGEIWSISVDPSGQAIASSGKDGSVVIWDKSGRELQVLDRSSDNISSVIFNPRNESLIAGGTDGNITFWDGQGRKLKTFMGHEGGVYSIDFSPDKEVFASAGQDGTIKLWTVYGQLLNIFDGHSGAVRSVSFSPDGEKLASGGDDNTIRVWNLTGQNLDTLEGHKGAVRAVTFSPDGLSIASGSANINDNTGGEIIVWNDAGESIRTLGGHAGGVWSVKFSPDGKTLAFAVDDGSIKLWDGGDNLEILSGHESSVRSINFSPNGKTLASASRDETVRLWGQKDNKWRELQTLEGHTELVASLSYSPDGKTLASASDRGVVILWDLDIDSLVSRSCYWLSSYMNNPKTEVSHQSLCKSDVQRRELFGIFDLHGWIQPWFE